jgi:eukaryotic-like serine/threonine-protein kinase
MMTQERWRQVEDLFSKALELPAADRSDWLDLECGDDAELRGEIESLLSAHQPGDLNLGVAIGEAAAIWAAGSSDRRIGPWRITGVLGEGGMGIVYAAVRDDAEYQRSVAIKLVKVGASDEMLMRFRHERQILASLSHPNIAQFLDGGTTADGQPYLVMERVGGRPLTQYCNDRQLSIRQRIELFRIICSAVQHAHQQLIVHRDLKPANIFVTEAGDVKLLDFGIARLLEGDASRNAVTSAALLTPDYASPEHVRGETVNTLTDIYSLGAVLYELLSGEKAHRLTGTSPAEIATAVCSNPVQLPSVAAASSKRSGGTARQLEGDLDNIILKSMHKDRDRRYASADQLSEDLARYLSGLPVAARPDTLRYRTGKFVKRHRAAIAAAVLIVAVVVTAAGAAIYEGRRAERRFAQVRHLANTFLFDFHDKIANLQGSTEARELVVKTALEYLASLGAEGSADTGLQAEIGEAYLRVADVQGNPRMSNLGHAQAAIESYTRARDIARHLLKSDPKDLRALRIAAGADAHIGDIQAGTLGQPKEGLQNLRNSVALKRQVIEHPRASEKDFADFVQYSNLLGDGLIDDVPAESQKLYGESIQVAQKLAANWPKPQSRQVLMSTFQRLGRLAHAQGDPQGCLKAYREAEAILAQLSQQFPTDARYKRELGTVYTWLGNASGAPRYFNLGDREKALEYYRRANVLTLEMLDADPKNRLALVDLTINQSKMSEMLATKNPREALAFANDCVRGATPPPGQKPTVLQLRLRLQCLTALALAEQESGRPVEALRALAEEGALNLEALAKNPSDLGGQETQLLNSLRRAVLLGLLGRDREAEERFASALAIAERLHNEHPTDLYFLRDLAEVHEAIARFRLSRSQKHLAVQSARTADQLWQQWPKLAVSSSYDQNYRARLGKLLRDVEQ